jgi:hypothetical protein
LLLRVIHNLDKAQLKDTGVHLVFINYDTVQVENEVRVCLFYPDDEFPNDYVQLYRDRVLSVH